MIQSTHIASPEVLIENRYTYKQQQDYLCFDGDFDNDDDDDIPTTTPTTATADLLLTLINQIPPIPSPPPPPPSPPSLFNFSYIDVTPPRTTTDPSTDSDTVTPLSSAVAITAIVIQDSHQ